MDWKDITDTVKKGEFKYTDIGQGGYNDWMSYRVAKYMSYIVLEVQITGETEKRYFGVESGQIVDDALLHIGITLGEEAKAHLAQRDFVPPG
jgi:hypothetical protein